MNSSFGNFWDFFCVMPKRINNTKTHTTYSNSDSSVMYVFTVNNLLYNQVRYLFLLSAIDLSKFKPHTHRFWEERGHYREEDLYEKAF